MDVIDRIGHLPPFWDRNAIFVANLMSLFFGNHGETDKLAEEIGGVHGYGGRLVPILDILFQGGPNVLILERHPHEKLLEYYRDKLELSLPDCVIAEDMREIDSELAKRTPMWVDGFVTDESLAKAASSANKNTLSSVKGSHSGNNKYLIHCHMEENDCPVFDTEMAQTPGDVATCFAKLRGLGYQEAVIKSQIGASGIGIIRAASDAPPKDLPDFLFHEGPCMIQGWLDTKRDDVIEVSSPSVQLFLNDDAVHLYDMTDQILSSEAIHEGNHAPPAFIKRNPEIQDELVRQAKIAGRWLHDQGYRGTASVDFLLVERRDRTEAYVCEINARVTGATYPAVLARHFLPGGAWTMMNLRMIDPVPCEKLLNALHGTGKLYEPGMKSGVLPINLIQNDGGDIIKGQFLFLSHESASPPTIASILPISSQNDRD